MIPYEAYLNVIDDRKESIDACACYIWDHPELRFREYQSAAYYRELLTREGFAVEENLAGIPTAFSGSFGSGRPIIGLLAEFDALSGLSQKSSCPEKSRQDGQTDGHGCGHNLLGAAAFGAALAVKKYLQETGKPGTVIFFGCPGEEGGSGKAFMARAGVFDRLDAAIAWHPASSNHVPTKRLLANCQVRYIFDGKPAHAAGEPYNGRSALDALEIMNFGVQFLREHMPRSASVHYAITDTGGVSPNVVQAHAESVYLVRDASNAAARALLERVNKIAEGAAMMTETTVRIKFEKACSNVILNRTLAEMEYGLMQQIPCPEPTEEDRDFIRKLMYPEQDEADPRWENPIDTSLHEMVPPAAAYASTDVGDVSWVCPTCRLGVATWGRGTGAHDWQTVAQGKTPWALNAARYAAKIMAANIMELLSRPELLEQAQAEHRQNVGAGYQCPIPPEVSFTDMLNL